MAAKNTYLVFRADVALNAAGARPRDAAARREHARAAVGAAGRDGVGARTEGCVGDLSGG